MIKCNNCDNEAVFKNESIATKTQYFCKACLPWSLQPKLRDGSLKPAVEAPVLVEEPPAEEPTPKPKSKKTVAVEPEATDEPDTADSN